MKNNYIQTFSLLGVVVILLAFGSINNFSYARGPSCSASTVRCDQRTFNSLLPDFRNARILAVNKDGNANKQLGLKHLRGKASCYANNSFCQTPSIDGYAYHKTASGACADPNKYTAAVDVYGGDPIYNSQALGALVFAKHNGKSMVFVTTDRGQMNKHGVKFDLVQAGIKRLRNSRHSKIDFYGLRAPPPVRYSKDNLNKIIECVTQFNNSFDLNKTNSNRLSDENLAAIANGDASLIAQTPIENSLPAYEDSKSLTPSMRRANRSSTKTKRYSQKSSSALKRYSGNSSTNTFDRWPSSAIEKRVVSAQDLDTIYSEINSKIDRLGERRGQYSSR